MKLFYLQRHLPKTLLLILLPAVVWLFVNNSINIHTHFLSDGYLISHAHPYVKAAFDSGPVESHHHSDTELFLLSLISNPSSPIVIVFFLGLFFIILLQILNTRHEHPEPVREYYQVNNYHAPPFS